MPFVVTRANVPISTEQEVALKERLGRAIVHVPDKSEAGLLLAFEGGAHLWAAGGDEPCAYVEASVFANDGHAGYEALSADAAQALQDVLGIPPERVYVRFSDIPVWSVGGMLVDRRMFA
ncbi:MAG: hypothetical protein E7Z99_01715 [Coriobacteriaceae bacterium]|nr:hypothetical protein [Coriobacteriaceae bacterium]